MTDTLKLQIGHRLRAKREQAGYTREKLGELCSLSPRFLANIELGDSTFSLDSLMTVCRVLSCSADYLLFGDQINSDDWEETLSKVKHFDRAYQDSVDKVIQGLAEIVAKAEASAKE